MRYAGQKLQTLGSRDEINDPRTMSDIELYNHIQNKPVVPSFNPEDLQLTPEMTPGTYYPGQDIDRDKYIRHFSGSGVT
jgi:hypothetical protein